MFGPTDTNKRLHRLDVTNSSTKLLLLQDSPGIIGAIASTWTVFAPERNRTGPLEYNVQPTPGTTSAVTDHAPVGRGGFFVAYRATGDAIEVAPLVSMDNDGLLKGASSALPDWKKFRPDTTEAFQAQYDTAAKFGSVSLETGELAAVVTDLQVGGKKNPSASRLRGPMDPLMRQEHVP